MSALFVAVLLKYFTTDIVLLFRPCLKLTKHKKGEENRSGFNKTAGWLKQTQQRPLVATIASSLTLKRSCMNESGFENPEYDCCCLFFLIDTRIYDAYVIYQMECQNKATEDRLSQFITKTLPSVLEDECGYRLFIHGRDDMPGEGQHLIDLVIILYLCLPSVFYNTWCL